MNRLQAFLIVVGLTNATAGAALAYEAPDFAIVGVWRFVLVVLIAGCGFLLMNLRSLRDADEKPLEPLTHRAPQHEDHQH